MAVIGIDLGTTNSCVAIYRDGKAVILENSEGDRTTPSVVARTVGNEDLVGSSAKRQSLTNPSYTYSGVKRLIGRMIDDPVVEKDSALLSYSLVEGPHRQVWMRGLDRVISPEEISAFILQKMKETAEFHLGEDVKDAVITVPAYFNDIQRQATRTAGSIAGLNVLRIINEPTAAALSYGAEKRKDGYIVVYDLGGGTFDVSILSITSGVIEVLATNGDTFLGGDDFDNFILKYVLDDFKDKMGIDLRIHKDSLQRVREACEKAKKELSFLRETEINLPYIASKDDQPVTLNMILSRSKLDDLVRPLVERTFESCKSALVDSGLDISDINSVILVGGQTRMPLVIESVRDFFGQDPDRSVNPDEVVAMGAAIQAGILQGESRDVLLLDVTPFSLGIEVDNGKFSPVIHRNQTIPTKETKIFTTVEDNQNVVSIRIFQGEENDVVMNQFLGEFDLAGFLPSPAGVPQIAVSFGLDENGLVSVTAEDMETGFAQNVEVRSAPGMSLDQVAGLTEKFAENEALKSLNDTISRAHDEVADLYQRLENVSKAGVRDVRDVLESAMISDDLDQIQDCILVARNFLSKDI